MKAVLKDIYLFINRTEDLMTTIDIVSVLSIIP
jgi:hypothetical protein